MKEKMSLYERERISEYICYKRGVSSDLDLPGSEAVCSLVQDSKTDLRSPMEAVSVILGVVSSGTAL